MTATLPNDAILDAGQCLHISGVFELRSYIAGTAFWATGRQTQTYHRNMFRGKVLYLRRAKV